MKRKILVLLTISVFPAFVWPMEAQSWKNRTDAAYSREARRVLQIRCGNSEFARHTKPSPYVNGTIANQVSYDNLLAYVPSSDHNVTDNSFSYSIYPIELNEQPATFDNQQLNNSTMKTSFFKSEWYNKNRRNIYSSLWAYASLNYLYADLVQFMDKDEHLKYHTGTVNGFEMTPGFIAGSVVFMQIAIANVFLPQIIKNDRALRWVQIASGAIMTLVQTATLFVDQPTSYYAILSGFEIAATTFITIDALKWKTQRK
jgi:hypothetical protein